jgi:N-acetylated-alpha-linked acidic dipeptidase
MLLGFSAPRYTLTALLTLVSAGAAAAQSATSAPPAPGPRTGYTAGDATIEAAAEARASALPSPVSADSFSRVLSREPHVAGTPAQAKTRDYVISLMKSWGLETEVRAYDIYMPHPSAVRLWRLGSAADSEELSLPEGPVPGDSTSSAYPQVLTYNGYSAAGTAAGQLVYVNYGLIEDYAHLDSVGVSVAGKVVIARYGRSFRGIKAREAERHGAVGLLIYSDPADDGYIRGDVYPEGPMRPPQGVQRGSIMNDDGDPSTPGYPSLPGVPRLDPAKMAIPHIPVLPISYRNAGRLLQDLRGTGTTTPTGGSGAAAKLPQSWQGGLPFRYHVGPGPTRARLTVTQESGAAAYHTIWDTFGIIRGSEFPDEMVIVGGHRDGWGPGAADNVSGVVSVLEMARSLAADAKAGHRPKRTIVFATWDAEEWGLIGSTEYVEDDSLRLTKNAVAYINQDVAADGPSFGSAGSPSLRATVRDVTRMIRSPDAGNLTAAGSTVFDAWRTSATNSDSLGPTFGDPGGGSDFAGFANHLGIPIMSWGFGGAGGGVYHSAYDDYTYLTKFADPGFHRHAASAQIGTAVLLRLANADILPYDYVEYAHTMRRYVKGLDQGITAHGWTVSTAALATAIDGMERAAVAFAAQRDSALGGAPLPPTNLTATNAALLRVERAFTRPAGLRTRPWFRSLIYAADEDNGYANMPFPSVGEAIRANDSALTEREINDLAGRFDAASAALRDAGAAVRSGRASR